MSANAEDASINATVALVRAAGIHGYAAADGISATDKPPEWSDGLTAKESADLQFIQAASVVPYTPAQGR